MRTITQKVDDVGVEQLGRHEYWKTNGEYVLMKAGDCDGTGSITVIKNSLNNPL